MGIFFTKEHLSTQHKIIMIIFIFFDVIMLNLYVK